MYLKFSGISPVSPDKRTVQSHSYFLPLLYMRTVIALKYTIQICDIAHAEDIE
jgi:hypothetical protein